MNSEILEKPTLSPMEQDALLGPGCEHFEPIDGLALYTFGEMQAFSTLDVIPTADEYREVLWGLIKKGWLTVVKAPPEKRAARYAAKGIQIPPVDSLADVGCVDYTAQGYRWYWQLVKTKRTPRPETLEWADEDTCTLNCIAGTKRTCQRWAAELLHPFFGGIWGFYYPTQAIAVSGPERVGPWKSREAAPTHSRGWRITVHLRRVRRRRFSLPEWNVEGWITPEACIHLEGEIEGIRFFFSDYAASLNYRTVYYQASLTIRDGISEPQKPIFTTLNSEKTLAYISRNCKDTHFRWQDVERPLKRTRPLTISEALICLQEGFSAWKSTRANTPGA